MVFDTIDYLQHGSEKQKAAFRALTNGRIIEKLKHYSPLLTGTIPINIDTDESDLDIICYWKSKSEFTQTIVNEFAHLHGFTLKEQVIKNDETIVANFRLDEFRIELFGQNRPTREQESYRHMIIEHRIILDRGESFRQEVIRLKKEGVKTEPAFCKLLGIEGDPYEALLRDDWLRQGVINNPCSQDTAKNAG